jgi:MFS family permease
MPADPAAADAADAGEAKLGRNFNLLWTGQTVSQLGSMITTVAMPLVIVMWLHGSTFQVGLAETLQWLPSALIGLPVGAWIDRRYKRPLLLTANIGQALAIGSIPIAAEFGDLTITQVFIAAMVTGCFSMVFTLSYGNYLRTVVSRKLLRTGYSRSQATQSATRVAGPGVAGILVAAFGAPFALFSDAASFLLSTVAILLVRVAEPAASRASKATPYLASVKDGLAFVFRDPLMRSLTVSASLMNLCLTGLNVVEIPYLVRGLHASASAVGVVIALGSVGGIAGAAITPKLTKRVGDGRLIWLTLACTAPFGLLLPLAGGGPWLAIFVLGLLMIEAGITVSAIVYITFCQTYCPHDMLARVSASVQTFQLGIIPVGALVGGALAAGLGNHGALWVLVVANLAPALWRLLSPYARQRDLPEAPEVSEPAVIASES